MKKNVGKIDKSIRIILALIAAYFAYTRVFDPSWITYVLYVVAIVLLLTSLMSSCPAYMLLGKNTCKLDN